MIKQFYKDFITICAWVYISIDFKKWTFEGRKLARIDQILRRITMLPFLVLFKYLYILAVFVADGYKRAIYTRDNF